MQRPLFVRITSVLSVLPALPLGLLLLGATACDRPAGSDVAASVNGRAITYTELDKQVQFAQFDGTGPNDDQVAIQRLEVLRAMIDNEIMLQLAEKEGLLAADTEVESRFSEMKAPYSAAEFQIQLDRRKMTAEELKAQLRRDLSVQKLLNRETTAKVNVTDADIAAFYDANRESFNRSEPQIHLAQILVTPSAEPGLRNLQNDNAEDDGQAKKKIESLLKRLQQGEDFAQLASNYSEDPDSAPAGGDLGFITEAALDKANVELRKTILDLKPGQTTGILPTAEGYRILKLITREPAGQRDLNDPTVQQTIRETLVNRRDQLLKAAFYEMARNQAEVKNYLAESITSGSSK